MLKQQIWSEVIELCLKHIFARDILPLLREWIQPLRTLERMGGQDIIKVAMTYLITTGKVNNPIAVVETMKASLSPTMGDAVMTLAQHWKAMGIQEGLEKGKIEGIFEGKKEGHREEKLAIAKSSLQQGLSLEIISQITGLSIVEVKALANNMDA